MSAHPFRLSANPSPAPLNNGVAAHLMAAAAPLTSVLQNGTLYVGRPEDRELLVALLGEWPADWMSPTRLLRYAARLDRLAALLNPAAAPRAVHLANFFRACSQFGVGLIGG